MTAIPQTHPASTTRTAGTTPRQAWRRGYVALAGALGALGRVAGRLAAVMEASQLGPDRETQVGRHTGARI